MTDNEDAGEGAPVVGTTDPAGTPNTNAPGSSDIHTYIGNRLRQAFDDVAKQPVPDRFLELMAQLDKT